LSANLKKDSIDLSEWISQAEAARLRGVSRQAIAKLVRKGRLTSLIIGGHTFVNRVEIIDFEPLRAGRRKLNGDG
jgi:excisionase family DNA binding protein